MTTQQQPQAPRFITEQPPGREGLEIIFTRPDDQHEQHAAFIKLTPEDCRHILDNYQYVNQREPRHAYAGMVADTMITFAFTDNQHPALVDGQHRLMAAIEADWTGEWLVKCVWDGFDARTAYSLLDAFQRRRDADVIGRNLGLEQMTVAMQKRIVAATRYQNEWDTEYALPALCHVPPPRHNEERAIQNAHAFVLADSIIQDREVHSMIRRRMTAPTVLAVIAETLATRPEEATEFWRAVAMEGRGISSMGTQVRYALLEPSAKRQKDRPIA